MISGQLDFDQVDVFGATAFGGNPLAVVHDADELTDDQMRSIAVWTNLSETTFVLRPTTSDADYRVRIFSLATELPFAGHPTLGTCAAWRSRCGHGGPSGRPIVQECGAGLVPIRITDDWQAFAGPALVRSGPVSRADLEPALEFLGITPNEVVDARWCDNGPGWLGVLVDSPERLLALEPPPSFPHRVKVGAAAMHESPSAGEPDVEVRCFFPSPSGIFEDPVTGSFNAALGQWLFESGRIDGDSYLAAQGTAMGRTGRVHVERDDSGTVWVGGNTTIAISGTISL